MRGIPGGGASRGLGDPRKLGSGGKNGEGRQRTKEMRAGMVSSCSLSLAFSLSLFGQRVCKEGGGLRGRRWGVSAAIGGGWICCGGGACRR